MSTIHNLVLHITLPAGIQTSDGAVLNECVTIDAVSGLCPFYASVDQVKLLGGPGLRRMIDFTIAGQIYMLSKQVDLIVPHQPWGFNNGGIPYSYANPESLPYGDWPTAAAPWYPFADWMVFVGARNQWVANKAAQELLLNASILMAPGSHVLANFSVTRGKGYQNEGLSGKISQLEAEVKLNEIAVRSRGKIIPGGTMRPRMAAKGVLDWQERTPARTWYGNGAGANSTSMDPGSPGGGRGKPVKFFASPMVSPALTTMRIGAYQIGYPLQIVYPFPMGA
jgi:hypothetical protein